MKKTHHITANANAVKKGTVTAEVKTNEAVFNIRGYIGSDNVNSDTIAILVDNFLEKGVKAARVFVSSPGGSVFQANDIVAELKRFETVKVIGGAIIASAATRFLTEFTSEVRANSQIMIHKPSGGAFGTEDEVESTLKMLKNVTTEYRAAYAKKMAISEEDVDKLWAKGDKWLTAKEALAMKLVDSVSADDATVDAETAEMLVACGAPVKTTTTTKIKNTMERDELIASLGLAKDATDDQIKAAIADMKKKASQAEKAQKDEESQLEANADKDLNAAVNAKKITAAQVPTYKQLYLADPTATKAVLDSLTPLPKLSDELKGKKDAEATRKDWTLQDYLDKDPKALTAMEKEDPDRFKELNDAYYA